MNLTLDHERTCKSLSRLEKDKCVYPGPAQTIPGKVLSVSVRKGSEGITFRPLLICIRLRERVNLCLLYTYASERLIPRPPSPLSLKFSSL